MDSSEHDITPQEQAADLLQPVLQPGPKITPQKWFPLFLIILGLQYGWTFIQTLISVYKTITLVIFAAGFGVHEPIGFKTAASNLLDLNFLIDIITLIYLPFFFYLLYKRKRWGWILVFAGLLIGILGIPIQIYSYSIFSRSILHAPIDAYSIAWFALQAALKIIFARFMWRQDICDLFSVDKPTKTKTILYTSLITLLAFGALLFLR